MRAKGNFMNKLETLKWNFLYELNELNKLSKGGYFKISLKCEDASPADYKCDLIDHLQRKGALEIIDEYFGRALTSTGKKTNIATGASLRLFGYKPIEATVKIINPYFNRELDNQQDIIETKGKNLVQCEYDSRKEIATLTINKKSTPIKGAKGLITYYLYVVRKVSNFQDFKTYNKFVDDEKYSDKYLVSYVKFRQSIDALNSRVKKEGENYITSVVDVLKENPKRNEYKWNPKFSKK